MNFSRALGTIKSASNSALTISYEGSVKPSTWLIIINLYNLCSFHTLSGSHINANNWTMLTAGNTIL